MRMQEINIKQYPGQFHKPDNRGVPEVSPGQKTASEFVKRIRKLRWIGLEEEADLLRAEMASCGMTRTDSVVAMPRDTD